MCNTLAVDILNTLDHLSKKVSGDFFIHHSKLWTFFRFKYVLAIIAKIAIFLQIKGDIWAIFDNVFLANLNFWSWFDVKKTNLDDFAVITQDFVYICLCLEFSFFTKFVIYFDCEKLLLTIDSTLVNGVICPRYLLFKNNFAFKIFSNWLLRIGKFFFLGRLIWNCRSYIMIRFLRLLISNSSWRHLIYY